MSVIGPLKSRLRSAYGFFGTQTTRWVDNDMYGHVNNTVYVTLVHTTISSYLVQKCDQDIAKSQLVYLAVHNEQDYFRPIAFPSNIDLGLRISKLGRSSVHWEVGVFEEGKDEVAMVGSSVYVFVPRDKQEKSVEIDGTLRERLEELYQATGGKDGHGEDQSRL